MRVEIRSEAGRDLLSGAQFYELQNRGLGEYFLDRILDDVDSLKSKAGIHEVAYGLHCKPATDFPFAIYYRVEGNVCVVVAILDARQDPASIKRRLS